MVKHKQAGIVTATVTGAAILLAALFTLVGCSTDAGTDTGTGSPPARHSAFVQNLPDGTTVTCVWAAGYSSRGPGGLSCNWGGVE